MGPLRRYRGASYSERKRIVMELFKVGPKAYRSLLILALGEKDLGRRSSIFWQARTLAEKQVPGLVAEGKHEQANALLELAMSSGFSLSVQHFAAYCLMTDRVDAAIAKYEERHRVSQGKNVAIGLAYLYRAKGDLKRAQAVALKSGDATLIENILHERGDWKALAARVHRRVLGRAGLGGGGTQAQTKDSSKRRHSGGIVELGWLSAYHRLAGNPTQYQQVLSRIRSYPNREPSNGAAWYAAEALLINGEVKQAIALLLEHKRYTRVLRLLMAQHRFKEALELADRIGRSWKGEQRFNFDLSVAELLVRVGRRQAALELLRSAFEAEWKLDDLKRLDGVIRVLRELGMAQEAYALSVRILTQKPKFDPLAVLRALFEERKLAIEWWQLLEGEQRAPVERLARVRQILELRGAGLDTEIKWALGVARRQALEQLAAQAVRRKRYTIAESCLDRLVRLWPSANSHGRLGDFLVSLERWREASAAYLEAWEKDRTKPATLFNHGWALIQAGDTVDGRKLVRQARLLPLGSDHSRYQLAKVMRKRGWTTQARAEHTLILRTGGFRSWYVHNSIWYGAYRAKELGRFDQASVGYERYALQCFKSETAYGTLRSYLAVLAKPRTAEGG